jgi:hypothetical protein
MKKVEKILLAVIIVLTVLNVLFFSFPKVAKADMVCGIAHPQNPEYCAFTTPSNCCITIQ